MNNITIGTFIPGNSWLHKLDPRIKLISLIFLIVAVFIIPISADLSSLLPLGVILILTFVIAISAKIPILQVLKGLNSLMFLLVFTVVIQILSVGGQTLYQSTMHISFSSIAAMVSLVFLYFFTKKYFKIKFLYFILIVVLIFIVQIFLPYGDITTYEMDITIEGLLRSGFLFTRILIVVLFTSLLTFTTSTIDLNFAIEGLLRPFKIVRLPVNDIAMMISLTLRYIPTLLIETDKIMRAQASRGVDFKESSIKNKITQIISLIIPIFVVSFKRAEDLADAMEVRGYQLNGKRTRIDYFKIRLKDIFTIIGVVLILGVLIALRIIFNT